MTTEERQVFVAELIGSVHASLRDALSRVPENWNGIELRQWIADWFDEQTGEMDNRRKRQYRNDRLIHNL